MKRGFTLIELLIVIGISLVLIAAAFPIYTNLQSSSQLQEATSQLIQNIRLVRTLSVARFNDSPHGVYFNINPNGPDQYVIFQGTSYAARAQSYDRIALLDSALSLSSSLNQGSVEIIFSSAFGIPSVTGTLTIVHSATGNRVISINEMGKIEYE